MHEALATAYCLTYLGTWQLHASCHCFMAEQSQRRRWVCCFFYLYIFHHQQNIFQHKNFHHQRNIFHHRHNIFHHQHNIFHQQHNIGECDTFRIVGAENQLRWRVDAGRSNARWKKTLGTRVHLAPAPTPLLLIPDLPIVPQILKRDLWNWISFQLDRKTQFG